MHPAKPEKRGKWWVRLCIDMKQLRMKKECLKVAEHALLEQNWVKTGSKNALFRIKDHLSKMLKTQQPKKRRAILKKAKKNDVSLDEENEDEKIQIEENKMTIDELLIDVEAEAK